MEKKNPLRSKLVCQSGETASPVGRPPQTQGVITSVSVCLWSGGWDANEVKRVHKYVRRLAPAFRTSFQRWRVHWKSCTPVKAQKRVCEGSRSTGFATISVHDCWVYCAKQSRCMGGANAEGLVEKVDKCFLWEGCPYCSNCFFVFWIQKHSENACSFPDDLTAMSLVGFTGFCFLRSVTWRQDFQKVLGAFSSLLTFRSSFEMNVFLACTSLSGCLLRLLHVLGPLQPLSSAATSTLCATLHFSALCGMFSKRDLLFLQVSYVLLKYTLVG